jgi:hypothetical protein
MTGTRGTGKTDSGINSIEAGLITDIWAQHTISLSTYDD